MPQPQEGESFLSEGDSSFESCTEELWVKRHETLWYEDGNVVLVASLTGFKVHKTILAVHSDFFRSMFSLPQPQKDEDCFDGCPRIPMSDTAEEVATMLNIFYNGLPQLQTRTQPTWPVVRVMLTLGSKYIADKVYKEGIHELAQKYPSDLSKLLDVDPGRGCMDFKYDDPTPTANATRLMDSENFHLFALYDCCQLETSDLLHGVEGSSRVGEQLSDSDLVRCLDGRTRPLKAQYLIVSIVFALDREPKCASKWCERQLRQYRAVRVEERFTEEAKYDPLRTHYPNLWFNRCCEGLCAACVIFYVDHDLKRRQEVLEDLLNYL